MPGWIALFFLALWLTATVTACTGRDGASLIERAKTQAIYEDRTAEVGVEFEHFNSASGRYYFPEAAGPGGALFDYDGDGDLDLYLVQGRLLADIEPEEALFPPRGPLTDRLYRNDLAVDERGLTSVRFVDVTASSGIEGIDYGMGVAAGDFDNDGKVDLYVTSYGENRLWRNLGDGRFEEVTVAAGVTDSRWSTSAAFLDFDHDGWLDLFVATYVEYRVEMDRSCMGPTGQRDYCGPQAFRGDADRLFRNRGDGTFEDYSARAGIAGARGSGLGVVAADYDRDGWLDIYVANDLMENYLWLREPQRGATHFRESALMAGSAFNHEGKAEASMGVDAGDIDNDGDLDLFMTHLAGETNTLYLNDGAGGFSDQTRVTRLNTSLPSTGFGTAMLDYDNDGWLDIAVVNGAVYRLKELEDLGDPFPFDQPNQLFRNVTADVGSLQFEDVSLLAGDGFSEAATSRGLAVGDLDNDGDPDLVVFNAAGPTRVLLNRVGQDRSWLGVRLRGGPGARDMLGASAQFERADGIRMLRRARSEASYLSANDPRIVFGLDGDSSGGDVRVRWPSRLVEDFTVEETGRYHDLIEGAGRRVTAED